MTQEDHKTLLGLTAQIVSAHVQKNPVPAQGLPALIEQVYAALNTAGAAPVAAPAEKQQPFVPSKKSVFPDYIICLEDGRKLKTLKRHLRSTFDMTPEQYREKWGLAPDYPMVAPNYAEHRSQLAKALGLGRKPTETEIETEAEPEAEPEVKAAAPVAAPVAAPEPREPKRRADHTAASVFAKFPKGEAAPEAEAESEDAARKTRRRKPFSSQMARGMRK
jgi:predicted transcriptional regulator